ncbi:methyl-accepting chemotaxis protein [Celerinatantimonas diazotrophica]|uniref:Methyl-accepting chemotaxis sensory transducer with Cache sensor n=1 Tax=Celerinatantimonas diazotrophica TaxID=412034 RepID=A0A4R1JAJ1_9GAMM|nr:methyl-accepting chemotaxis protein [Celerinatantimonas diazotrophica]TCK47663.1 methyl-accepting chemotaxis sensory transducer with Cache sensor [Celerinatantimonas diazotrophica]CAG9296712.1 Methyl-accepting chemotaxis protein PctB [Celerinatantimonas diazotrophica]
MRLSLQGKLISVTVVFLTIIAVCLGYLAYNELANSREQAISSQSDAQAQAFTQYLSSWAKDRRDMMTALGIELSSQLKSDGKLNHTETLKFLNQAKRSGDFALTFVGLEDGTMYRHDPSLDKAGYDPRVRGWYKTAKKLEKPFITLPYIAVTGKKLAITFVQPIIIDGKFRGAIGGLYYLNKIVDNVLSLKIQGDGYAMLLDKRGAIAAFPQKNMILKAPKTLSSRLDTNNLIKLSSKPSAHDLSIQGKDTLLYLNPVPNTDWILGFVMNKNVLYASIYQLLIKIVIIVVVLLIISIIASIVIIRWLFKDLREVSKGLANIASGGGDLTMRIQTSSQDEIGELASNFNTFIEYLYGIISRLKVVGDSLVSEASNANKVSDESAKQIHNQQQEVTMVATAVHEMTVATQEIANNAANTASTSDNAVHLSEQGLVEVNKSQTSINQLADEIQDTSKAIGELDQHVQEIGSILSTISAIAEQTNLLALNAAIEAARAGEQGRGFAVVADEVRSLSQRTHSSTEEIRNMIKVLQEATDNAVTRMTSSHATAQQSVHDSDLAKQSFVEIRSAIETINEMATQIATAAEEQTSVTAEINENTNNINQVSDELNKTAQSNAKQAEILSDISEKVRADIGQFKL